jgi:hypothetical protein
VTTIAAAGNPGEYNVHSASDSSSARIGGSPWTKLDSSADHLQASFTFGEVRWGTFRYVLGDVVRQSPNFGAFGMFLRIAPFGDVKTGRVTGSWRSVGLTITVLIVEFGLRFVITSIYP